MPILELKGDESAIGRVLRAISDALFRRGRIPANKPLLGLEQQRAPGSTNNAPCHTNTNRHRLAEAVARLERLEAERERQGDSRFGKTTENRIVWGELIELELQEIGEQVSRVCSAAGRGPRAPIRSNLRAGGPHERNNS